MKRVYDQLMIINAVMDYYKVDKNDLLYKKSKWNKGKGALMYLLNRDAGMTFSDIGVLFGGLDASGIGRICKQIRTQAVKDKEKSKAIAEIEKLYK